MNASRASGVREPGQQPLITACPPRNLTRTSRTLFWGGRQHIIVLFLCKTFVGRPSRPKLPLSPVAPKRAIGPRTGPHLLVRIPGESMSRDDGMVRHEFAPGAARLCTRIVERHIQASKCGHGLLDHCL